MNYWEIYFPRNSYLYQIVKWGEIRSDRDQWNFLLLVGQSVRAVDDSNLQKKRFNQIVLVSLSLCLKNLDICKNRSVNVIRFLMTETIIYLVHLLTSWLFWKVTNVYHHKIYRSSDLVHFLLFTQTFNTSIVVDMHRLNPTLSVNCIQQNGGGVKGKGMEGRGETIQKEKLHLIKATKSC